MSTNKKSQILHYYCKSPHSRIINLTLRAHSPSLLTYPFSIFVSLAGRQFDIERWVVCIVQVVFVVSLRTVVRVCVVLYSVLLCVGRCYASLRKLSGVAAAHVECYAGKFILTGKTHFDSFQLRFSCCIFFFHHHRSQLPVVSSSSSS